MSFKPFTGSKYSAYIPPANRQAEALVPIEIKYGQNLTPMLAILPFTLSTNQEQKNSLLAMLDGNGDTFYEISNSSANENDTTRIIMDLGIIAPLRAISTTFKLQRNVSDDTVIFAVDVSTDGSNWTQIGTQTADGALNTLKDYSILAGTSTIRFIRLNFTTQTGTTGSGGRTIQVFQIDVHV